MAFDLKPPPVSPVEDCSYSATAEAVLCCQLDLYHSSPTVRAHGKDFLFADFGLSIPRSTRLSASPLCFFIPHVVGVCAEKEVIGADTKRVVAPMQNMQLSRDRAMEEYPGQPMRSPLFTLQSDKSITLAIAVTAPNPALISLFDLRPEPCQRFHLRSMCHRL